MQMALTGERIAAAEAHRIGLVTQVVEPPALLDRALALAQTIAANAPLAVQAIKKLSRQTQHLSEADAQQLTELYWGVLRDTEDRLEGRKAFAEKRAPATPAAETRRSSIPGDEHEHPPPAATPCSHSPPHALAALALPACGAGRVPEAEADHARRAVRPRRRQRHPGARHRAAHGAAAGPDHRHRQPARRRRQPRHRPGRACGARRLHDRHRVEPGDDESLPRHEGAVQDRARLRADRPARLGADRAGREHAAAVQDAAGVHRLREGQPGQARATAAPATARRSTWPARSSPSSTRPRCCTCPTAARARRSPT